MERKEVIEKSQGFIERADKLYSNFKTIQKDDIEKASELLWGVFVCYVNAYWILRTGEPVTRHGKIREVSEGLVSVLNDTKFDNARKSAEKLHANYYHGFLNLEDLQKIHPDIKYATEKIHDLIIHSY